VGRAPGADPFMIRTLSVFDPAERPPGERHSVHPEGSYCRNDERVPMLYAILAYHVEAEVLSWTPEADAAVMVGLRKAHDRLNQKGQLGPAARLGETRKARTLRGPGGGMVIDGPFAETKEQLLGLYVVDCASEDAAIEAARELRRANPSAVYEIRPITLYLPGVAIPVAGEPA
jgi:hypothetical protein